MGRVWVTIRDRVGLEAGVGGRSKNGLRIRVSVALD